MTKEQVQSIIDNINSKLNINYAEMMIIVFLALREESMTLSEENIINNWNTLKNNVDIIHELINQFSNDNIIKSEELVEQEKTPL